MSNGSRRSSEESRQRQAQHRSRWLGFPFVCWCALLGGCHSATLHQRFDLQAELASVASEDLFYLAVWHARSGDLLRAEQYLSAARQRGYDEAAVVYWLVRVCVASSRYQSALRHAADHLRDHPLDWSLRLIVASIHEALGDTERARMELERVVRAAPQNPLPHYRLAMLYRDSEVDQDRVKEHLAEYIKLTPQGPHAAEARSVLKEVVDLPMAPRQLSHPGPIHTEEEQSP